MTPWPEKDKTRKSVRSFGVRQPQLPLLFRTRVNEDRTSRQNRDGTQKAAAAAAALQRLRHSPYG